MEDCQWLQQLATFGLLKAAFRPEDNVVALRSYLRHRDNLIKCAAQHIQHMQKALTQRRKKGRKPKKHEYPLEMGEELFRITGANLTKLPGIDVSSALTLIGEIGVDMAPWRSAKAFASWLGLCPGNKVSGGKRLSGKTKPCANRAAVILRMAANSLYNADSALGAFLRRMKMRFKISYFSHISLCSRCALW